MSGHRTGVATRMLELCKVAIAFHCVAHRGALTAKSAAEMVPYLVTVFEVISAQLAFFFTYVYVAH
jgi:hypothetical protein